jgi:branched-chain amino acid aminotransferase
LIVTRGDGALGVDPASCEVPRVIAIVGSIQLFPEATLRSGISLATSSLRRPSADVLDPRVKSLNYLNNVLAKREAKRAGADDALLLNGSGRIAEASAANLFIVRNGVVRTPPPTDGALDGITRRTVIELASALGIRAEEASLGRVDVLGADETFLTGTGAGLVPVGSLDGARIGDGTRPVFDRLAAAFDVARVEWAEAV